MTSAETSLKHLVRGRARRYIRKFAEEAASAALRSRVFRGYAFDVLHLLTDSASATTDGLQYFFSTNDWVIGRSLYASGHWDSKFLEASVALLAEEPFRRQMADSIFIDVGANIGTTTLHALHRFKAARAVAIEPSRECLPYLRANIAANCLSERCTIMEFAASDTEGEVSFQANRDNSGGGEIESDREKTDYVVPSRKLDDLLAQLGIAPDEISLVWMDTEGHEYRVLRGAEGILSAGVPVLIEFWPQRLRHNGDFDSLVRLLAEKTRKIIDVRAYVQQTRQPWVEPTVSSLTARANILGSGQTDLLIQP